MNSLNKAISRPQKIEKLIGKNRSNIFSEGNLDHSQSRDTNKSPVFYHKYSFSLGLGDQQIANFLKKKSPNFENKFIKNDSSLFSIDNSALSASRVKFSIEKRPNISNIKEIEQDSYKTTNLNLHAPSAKNLSLSSSSFLKVRKGDYKKEYFKQLIHLSSLPAHKNSITGLSILSNDTLYSTSLDHMNKVRPYFFVHF